MELRFKKNESKSERAKKNQNSIFVRFDVIIEGKLVQKMRTELPSLYIIKWSNGLEAVFCRLI